MVIVLSTHTVHKSMYCVYKGIQLPQGYIGPKHLCHRRLDTPEIQWAQWACALKGEDALMS